MTRTPSSGRSHAPARKSTKRKSVSSADVRRSSRRKQSVPEALSVVDNRIEEFVASNAEETQAWCEALDFLNVNTDTPSHDTTISDTLFYLEDITREPKDVVYYQALASGEVVSPAPPKGVSVIYQPKHYNDARKCTDSDLWRISEEKEWSGMWEKDTFEVQPIRGQKLHHMLWTYKVKSGGTRKSRLCFDGRHQDPSTYDSIRSPTMRLTSFRIMLAKAASKGWVVYADDAAQAFLNAHRPLDKPLWASFPQGFRQPGQCLLVKRQVYGLHDAPVGWFNLVREHMTGPLQQFTQSETDECLFVKEGCEVVVHVDDFLSTGEADVVAEYRRILHETFAMTGGVATEYYGLNIRSSRNNHEYEVSCEKYIHRMLHKLEIKPGRQVYTPAPVDYQLPILSGPCTNLKLQRRYRQIVGCVMHPAVTCRPDIAHAVKDLSMHLNHPNEEHMKAAVRVVHYLYTTRAWALKYGLEGSSSILYGTSDASFNSTHDSRSVTGWCYHMNGGAVSWKCKNQSLVTLSSTDYRE
jgi:hypothetical protein